MIALEESSLVRCLPETAAEALRKLASERMYEAGAEIFKEGDSGDGLYIIKDGTVRISALLSSGERKNLSVLGPGEVFGEMAVLDDAPRSATATAEKTTIVYFISRAELMELLREIPQLSASLIREISRRLREFNKHYIEEVLQAERLALVGKFARSIVHDLKNPLNIIGMAAEMAGLESATPQSRASSRERIRKQVDRINNMVTELLEFTRGTNNSTVLVPMDFQSFIHHVIEEIRPEIQLKNSIIEYKNQPPTVNVPLNPERLSRVFHNLLHNATDAMGDGGKIYLSFDTADGAVTTNIEDTGPGIAPEIADQLFQPFASYGKTNGTGLGLSISKKIVEDHGGTIAVRSEPGRGAIFSFTLPMHRT